MRPELHKDHKGNELVVSYERVAGLNSNSHCKRDSVMLAGKISSLDWHGISAISLFAALTLMVWTAPSYGAAENQGSLSVAVDLFDDWGSGACGEGVVINNGSDSSQWEVNVDLPGSVTSYWSSEISHMPNSGGEGSDMSHSWRVTGVEWNKTLEPGASATFGFCIDRAEASQTTSTDDSDMPMAGPHPHPVGDSEFIDLATFGLSNGSDHTGHDGLVGGRTAITTEALLAYNHLRAFVGLAPATINDVGAWAFANGLTNNAQAWGNDQMGVGLWYAMQGAKVGWMADDWFDPQVIADIERTARLGSAEDVMAMVAAYGHEGYAQYLNDNGLAQTFINTLKMEPHYAGWMHDRAHGMLSIENVAIAHDVNHLTVLSHDQMQPFMNDTWDWPQWPALEVSSARVLEYFQSMVVLGDPLGFHLEDLAAPTTQDNPVVTPPAPGDSVVTLPAQPDVPYSDGSDMPMTEPHPHPVGNSEFIDLATFGLTYGSNHTDHTGLVGGRTAITTEALLAYNNLRAFTGLAPVSLDAVGAWAFANNLTNNTQAWGTDQMGVGLWYAMQGAKVGWMADDRFDPQAIANIERTARLGSAEDVMGMVVAYGHEGFAEYLTENGYAKAFISTLKMEPHYAGWMHDRAHGWLSIEGVAIAHDVNHLTVLSHDQMQPFMNDTWDWPQWPALEVSQARVLEYFQSMVVLGDPLGNHLDDISGPPFESTAVPLPPGC